MSTLFKPEDEVFVIYDKDFIAQRDLDNKLLSLLSCIHLGASLDGEYVTTIEHTVMSMGYKPDSHKGKINEHVISLLEWLETENRIFILPKSIHDIRATDIFTIKINLDNNIFDRDEDKQFVTFTKSEFRAIASANTKSDKSLVMRVWLNIKKRWDMTDKTPYARPSQKTIAKECGISKGSQTDNPIEDLKTVKLLYEHITGSYVVPSGSKEGNRVNAPNVFSNSPIDPYVANRYMLDWYRERYKETLDKFDPVARPGAKIKRDKIYQEQMEARAIHEIEGYEMEQAFLEKEYPKIAKTNKDVWGEPPPPTHVPLDVADNDPAALDEAEPEEDADQVLADDLNHFEEVENLRQKEKDAEIRYFKDICNYLQKNEFNSALKPEHMHHLLNRVTKFFKTEFFDGGKNTDRIDDFYLNQATLFRDYLTLNWQDDAEDQMLYGTRDEKMHKTNMLIDYWEAVLKDQIEEKSA